MATQVGPSSELVDAALALTKRGMAVFPCYGTVDYKCGCGDSDCKDAGKHPRITGWQKSASCDPEVIQAWWTRWPNANIGLATGKASRVVVLDIDGPEGEASLKTLTDVHGELPETLTVTTGRGRHLYFEVPSGE